jgi:hypothetical protein
MAMARPRKKTADRRTDVLRIRLTDSERKELDQAARTAGLDTSTWARYELLEFAKRLAHKRLILPTAKES